jgi:hypothetical protein
VLTNSSVLDPTGSIQHDQDRLNARTVVHVSSIGHVLAQVHTQLKVQGLHMQM